MNKTKTFKVLISEEVTYEYKVEAYSKNNAEIRAMNIHEVGNPCESSSVDRCEVINCEEVKE